jgi:hypothetical protein
LITTPTVLVLGAGASHPYGFPTGEQLKREICAVFSRTAPAAQVIRPPHSQTADGRFFEFREAFLKSGQPSIDAFLERRPNFLDVGKLAIAYCLIPYEEESKLYQVCNPARGEDWYQHLSVKLDTSFEKFGENRLSIITFNYDRSLEHYLLTALQNLHGRYLAESAKALAQIPIIHVYGQLGPHPYPHGRKYNPHLEPDPYHAVSEAASGIKLLHEETSSSLEQARKLLGAAERIAFLGFGYHPLNIYRIAIDTAIASKKWIVGTTRDLLGREVQDVQDRIRKAFGSPILNQGEDSLSLLRSTMFLG